MNFNFSLFLITTVVRFQSCAVETVTQKREMMLWYQEPANEWVEALPLGNLRLEAMVFGGVHIQRIQLNEESVWPEEAITAAPACSLTGTQWF